MKTVAIYLIFATFVLLSEGCTLMGYWIGGSADDKSRGGPHVDDLEDIRDLKPGQSITIGLRDGDTLAGNFVGFVDTPTSYYESAIAEVAYSMEGGSFPPHLWSRIRIITVFDGALKIKEGEFGGFSSTSIFLRSREAACIERIPLKTVASVVDSLKRSVRGTKIQELLNDGEIPVMTALTIVGKDSSTTVPLQAIIAINTEDVNTGKYVGLAVGAAVDIAVIVAVAVSMEHFMSFGPTGGF